jgi:hypothetical protein
MDSSQIDYDALLAAAPGGGDPAALLSFLQEELPYAWLDAYVRMSPHRHNVHRITVEEFEYLWDLSSEFVQQGIVLAAEAVDDRLIAAHGISRVNPEARRGSRLRRRTLGPLEVVDASQRSAYDRGHAIGHVLGGVLDLNIIPQSRSMNRGGLWRRMERYCQEHLGTYFFCRPLYTGLCSHPAALEFGILKPDRSWWVRQFPNAGSPEELSEFERLYREKIGAQDKAERP